ncbi:DNA repair protein RAD7 [Nakaseomyces bracarensis]|uniref:DNA repair protein RAD7 n=1 Tax=Nakaseomyces bracarensis TaxID=273131 RepID=A0ABR4NTP1_9SACH
MYRSRNRNRQNSGIKGPSSALTQFLKEEGISAEAIRERWLQRYAKKDSKGKQDKSGSEDVDVEEHDIESIEVDGANDSESTISDKPKLGSEELNITITSDNNSFDEKEEEEDEDVEEVMDEEDIPILDDKNKYQRRMKKFQVDSDEEEYDADENSRSATPSLPAKRRALDKATLEKKSKDIIQNRKKKQKRAANLLNRQINPVSTLQSICISKISDNIYKWQKGTEEDGAKSMFGNLRDVLGGVSKENLNNLANALSKNRALNDQTLQLFLKTDLEALTFHDCSKVSYDGYKTLAIFSPHLEKLSLQMCGQLNNEALLYLAEKLPNLKAIHLDGPFLINENTWIEFFELMKGRLEEFKISNTHRFSDKALSSLLVNCGHSLRVLSLVRLDSVFNYALLPQYLNNEQFSSLEIGYPYNDEDVSDEVLINILGQVGHTMKKLVITGCTELTDSFIINGIGAFIGENNQLEELGLEELDQLSNDSLIYLFSQLQFPFLTKCSFRRSIQIGDGTILELLQNSAVQSLKYLDFNSLKDLTKDVLSIISCPYLTYIDLAFVRSVDDAIIEKLGNQNPKLQIIEVFGDSLVTEKAKIRPGLALTGRQSDSI